FDKSKLKTYKLSIEGFIPESDSAGVYIIKFSNSHLRYGITNSFYERSFKGKVYVRSSDYSVLQCEVLWERDTITLNRYNRKYFSKNRNREFWNKVYDEHTVQLLVKYEQDTTGKYLLSYANYQWYERGVSLLNTKKIEIRSNIEIKR